LAISIIDNFIPAVDNFGLLYYFLQDPLFEMIHGISSIDPTVFGSPVGWKVVTETAVD
tara:strand:- start:263 stop:436 length:174 start_codon:yes stop_codon:yes gene_type:complete